MDGGGGRKRRGNRGRHGSRRIRLQRRLGSSALGFDGVVGRLHLRGDRIVRESQRRDWRHSCHVLRGRNGIAGAGGSSGNRVAPDIDFWRGRRTIGGSWGGFDRRICGSLIRRMGLDIPRVGRRLAVLSGLRGVRWTTRVGSACGRKRDRVGVRRRTRRTDL